MRERGREENSTSQPVERKEKRKGSPTNISEGRRLYFLFLSMKRKEGRHLIITHMPRKPRGKGESSPSLEEL